MNPMMLSHFKELPLKEMIIQTWQQGEFVTLRKSEDYIVLLYQVHNYYVEMYYNFCRKELDWVRPFSSTDDLDPYLHGIDISELLSS